MPFGGASKVLKHLNKTFIYNLKSLEIKSVEKTADVKMPDQCGKLHGAMAKVHYRLLKGRRHEVQNNIDVA